MEFPSMFCFFGIMIVSIEPFLKGLTEVSASCIIDKVVKWTGNAMSRTHVNGKFICGYSIDLNTDHGMSLGYHWASTCGMLWFVVFHSHLGWLVLWTSAWWCFSAVKMLFLFIVCLLTFSGIKSYLVKCFLSSLNAILLKLCSIW